MISEVTFTVDQVGYLEDLVMPRSDMKVLLYGRNVIDLLKLITKKLH